MSLVGSVNLELSWRGSYTYGRDWDIKTVDLKMEKGTHEVFAHIQTNISEKDEQPLKITASNKNESLLLSDKTSFTVNLPVSLLSTIEVSARIFQVFENRNMMLRQPDGSFTYEKRARRDDLPVFIDEMLAFEPDQTYQMRIVNKEGTLKATIEKKVGEIAIDKLPVVQVFVIPSGQTAERQADLARAQQKLDKAKQREMVAKINYTKALATGNEIEISAAKRKQTLARLKALRLQRK